MQSLYLERYAWKEELFPDYAPPRNLGLVIVLPAYKEEAIQDALASLNACIRPQKEVLIIVLINESEAEQADIQAINSACLATVRSFESKFKMLVSRQQLPAKKAGVGLARKIGMDEAVRIFKKSENDGAIVCFDADCRCDENYLTEIETAYDDEGTQSGIVFYEHQLHRAHHPAIVNYELYLRYYIDVLRFTGFPYAYQTLGSCITVRCSMYEKVGGMNTRKAGEDFYFLNKTIPLGGFVEINTTTIRPSDRISDRVPFGTGKAVKEILDVEEYAVYHPSTFEDLKLFFSKVDSFWTEDRWNIPKSLVYFLGDDWQQEITALKGTVSTQEQFRKRFFHWFDAFKILKFVHFARDHFYQDVTLEEALHWLKTHVHLFKGSLESQLIQLRYHDRNYRIN